MTNHFLKRIISNEAIDYQHDSTLHAELSEAIRNYRSKYKDKQVDNDTLQLIYLDNIVKKHTGLTITFLVDNSNDINAYVYVPDMNRNNPILSHFHAWFENNSDMVKALRDSGEILAGIDLKQGKVSGYFSKVDAKLYVTRGSLISKEGSQNYFTAEELAAVIMHELGHLMSYYESMMYTVRRNVILASHLRDYQSTIDSNQRLTIINKLKAQKMLDKSFDGESIVKGSDNNSIIMIASSAQKSILEDPNCVFHNFTAFESASDQFVVRHGAGDHIGSALTKIYRYYSGGWADRISYWISQFWEFSLWVASVVFTVVGIGMIMISILIAKGIFENISLYDDPKDRIKRIRNEMVGHLKQPNLPKVRKSQLVAQIDRLDGIYDEFERYLASDKSISNWIVNHLIPFAILNRKSKTYQQTLEQLSNNELFYLAAKLRG